MTPRRSISEAWVLTIPAPEMVVTMPGPGLFQVSSDFGPIGGGVVANIFPA